MDFVQKKSYNEEDIKNLGLDVGMLGENAPKFPKDNMCMVSRITEVSAKGGKYGNGYVEAELDITPDLWFFDCHFLGDPVMPGCLGLDALWQLMGFYLGWSGGKGRGRALGVKDLRFTGQILPDAKRIVYKVNMSKVYDGKLHMGVADAVVELDDKVIYNASQLKVCLMKDTADF